MIANITQPNGGKAFCKSTRSAENADSVAAWAHRMKTETGRKFYAQRKPIAEPVFAITKEVMGFHRFMIRVLNAVQGERVLVCMAFNPKHLCVLSFV